MLKWPRYYGNGKHKGCKGITKIRSCVRQQWRESCPISSMPSPVCFTECKEQPPMIPGGYLLGITKKSTLGFTKIESLQERNLPFSKSPFLSCARRSLDTLEKSEEVIPFLESPADQPVRKLSDYFLQLTSLRERERETHTHTHSRPDMQVLFIRGQLVCT